MMSEREGSQEELSFVSFADLIDFDDITEHEGADIVIEAESEKKDCSLAFLETTIYKELIISFQPASWWSRFLPTPKTILLFGPTGDNAMFYTAIPDPNFPGHFRTYDDCRQEILRNPNVKLCPDSGLEEPPHSRCDEPGCLTAFKSKAAARRHQELYHFKNIPKPQKRMRDGDGD